MEAIHIDFFRPEDAPGVARLFRRVYGEGYPIDIYYRPERLIEENAAGRVLSSIARTPAGEVVGHDALVLLDPVTRLYENAAGAVLPGFRGQGVFFNLMKHNVFEHAKQSGLREILGEPVCNHLQLQKMCLKLGFRETGLEVDLMPAAAYTAEESARGRVSVMLGYFLHKPVPRTVYPPPAYREELRFFYEGQDLDRTFAAAEKGLPVEGNSAGGMTVFDSAQVARIEIRHIGADFADLAARLEGEARDRGSEVLQVWLPLGSPFVAAATDILRGRGFFLGGMLPNRPGGDGLLMQKVTGETDWEDIRFYSERAKRIGEIIRRDREN